MPRGDATGPRGMGSQTGRAAGFCGGSGMAGFQNAAGGRGMGRGMGRGGGFGWRNWFRSTGLPGWMRFGGNAQAGFRGAQSETDALRNELEEIKQKLNELGNQS